jgi:regulator of protease activity HflC (stomatin/prohibitin superfamily)
MAMEITEMVYEQRGPKKPGTLTPNRTPKAPAKEKGKLLSSMKKKFINGVEVMDTELRKNVPVKQVKKETQEFVSAMDDARKKMEREKAEKEKVKLSQPKMYGPVKAAIGPRLDRSPKETRKAKPGYIKE